MAAKGNLLLVDDEPLLVSQLQLILEDHADTILTAGHGLEGLDKLYNNTIHCVVCDINMPKMNGVEMLKRLREQGFEVPFIIYTGHGNKELMLEAAKYGAFDFLDKPMLHGLIEVVERGLKLGLEGVAEQSEYISDYTKMLADLNRK